MTYNYVIATGHSTISGSQLNISHKNQSPYFGANLFDKKHFRLDENGKKKDYPFVFDIDIITGSGVSLVSLNSQTMLEATGVTISQDVNQNYYIQAADDLGNYIFDIDNSQGEIMFDPVLNLNSKDIIYYDKRDFAAGISINSPLNALDIDGLRSKVNTAYSNAGTESDLFENHHVFFNGQKLKYAEDPVAEFTGVEVPVHGTTGDLFAIPKQDRTIEVRSNEPDIFGPKFVENHVDFYVNGMEQTTEDLLQIHTGVYMIESGVDSSVYLVNKQTLNYFS